MTIVCEPEAVVAPHADAPAARELAARAALLLEGYDTLIILGPDHYGYGGPVSVHPGPAFEGLSVDPALAQELYTELSKVVPGAQLTSAPFTREKWARLYAGLAARVVHPSTVILVSVRDQTLGLASALASTLSYIASNTPGRTALLSTVDLAHYAPPADVARHDSTMIGALSVAAALKSGKLLSLVSRELSTTDCLACLATALYYSLIRGATVPALLGYALIRLEARGAAIGAALLVFCRHQHG